MNNINITNRGEQLTFFQIFSEKKWKIEIPIIQRDYAQGRKTSSEIRETFLKTLYDHLLSGDNIDLDFVYGSLVKSDVTLFIPLDGQQRLTTLFLLHWYLAIKEDKKEIFNNHLVEYNKSKFTYETRTSSREFCDAFVISTIDLNNLLPPDKYKLNSLSKTIKDSTWYFGSWDNDPTIQSMLTMLDAIYEKFKETNALFEKLLDKDNPVITFQFLNLKEFKLTDDLYIKMNARGKQLTPFENFKAKFEQFIKELKLNKDSPYTLIHEGIEHKVSVHEYFSHNIDTTWANLFWNYRNKNNLFDNELMNFIRVVAANHYALKEKNEEQLEKLKLLIGKEDANRKDIDSSPISFIQYNDIECLDEKFIFDLISIFDLLINGNDKIKIYLSDDFYLNEEEIFNEVIKNSLNYTQRVRFFAFYHYLITNKTSNGLLEWMRVIFNLSENTIYNRAVEYARSINAVESLLTHSSNILNYLSDSNNFISGFLDLQIIEERIKAILIQKSDEWKNAIYKMEKHGYFKGQIGFILNFAGIEDYFNTNKNCNWTPQEDKQFFTDFNTYAEKANSIFNNDGLKSFSEFTFERALLSKGPYLLRKGSNLSFLIDNDRDIGWKRLLRDDNMGKRKYIQSVFEDTDFDIKDAQKSLEIIISKSKVTDWKKHFIELPKIIGYLGPKKYIRFDDEGNLIYLLKKERMSATYAEYYTYTLFKEYLEEKKFMPFERTWYCDISGDEKQPRVVIDDWEYRDNLFEIDIFYSYEEKMFKLYFHDKNDNNIPTDVINIINTNVFVVDGKYYLLSINRNEIMQKLNDLCDAFNKL